MVEKTLIVIITVLFLMSSWWWTNRQDATEEFYEQQLRERDAVISQLSTLALSQLKGKTPQKVQALFQNLYPEHNARFDNGMLFSGSLGVRFAKGGAAKGFVLPWDEIDTSPSQ